MLYGLFQVLIGFRKLQKMTDALRTKRPLWYLYAVSAVLTLLFGFIVVLNPDMKFISNGYHTVAHDRFSLVTPAAPKLDHGSCRSTLPEQECDGVKNGHDRKTQSDSEKSRSSVIQAPQIDAVYHVVKQQQDFGDDARYGQFSQQNRYISF